MPDLNYTLTKKSERSQSSWSGGVTTEILISPKNAVYANRDFDYRISSAKVELPESTFTPLNGYIRHIMLLAGKMKLVHDGHHSKTLAVFEQDYFDGGWETKSFGLCTDFNLMLRKGYLGALSMVGNDDIQLTSEKTTGFFALQNGLSVSILTQEEKILVVEMNAGDFLMFDANQKQKQNYIVQFSGTTVPEALIRVEIWRGDTSN